MTTRHAFVPALVLAALLGLAPGATARAESRPPYQGVAIGSLLGAPGSADPVEAMTHADVTLVLLLFDTLYRADGHGNVVPHLADAPPELSEDRLVARIDLRPEVRAHSGRVLGAADVVASLRRLGRSRASWLLAPVESIREEDGRVVLRLARPVPELALLLSAPQAAITPGGKAPASLAPDGTGPFRLAAIDRRRARATLRRHDHHFDGPPYLDALLLRWFDSFDAEARAYEAGESHLSLRGEVAFSGHRPKYRTDSADGPATILVYLGFGNKRPAIASSVDFRRALSFALGRDAFRRIGSGERVVPSVFPAAQDLGAPPTPARARRQQLAEARRSLAKVQGLTGVDLELLVDKSRPDDREVGERVVAALFSLGIAARLIEEDPARFAERVARGRCDLYIGHLAAPAPSPALQVAAAFAAGGDDWAVARLRRGELDLAEALAEFGRRLPVVPLFHRAVRVHHRANLLGVQFDRTTRLSYADLFLFGPSPRP